MAEHEPNILISLLPYVLISIGFAFGNFFMARRVGGNPYAWFVLTIIPVFGMFFLVYVYYKVAFRVIDYLKEISERLGRTA